MLSHLFSRVFKLWRVVLFAVLFAALPAHAGFFNGKVKFYTLKTPHFYIHFPAGSGPIAEDFRGIVEDVYARLTKRMEWEPSRRTHVVLTDKSDAANGVASVLPDNYILLYTAMPSPDSTLDHYKDYYEYLFTHEFTHILHIDQHNRMASPGRYVLGKIVAPNGATPGWMREGMAVYEESQLEPGFGRASSDYVDMYARTSYFEEKFPRIDQVAGLGTHYPGGLGPYVYGGKFFDWLAKNYGEDRMYQYEKEYASSMWLYSLNNKARRVYGKSFYKLWGEFRAALSKQYDADRDRLNGLGLTSFQTVAKNGNGLYDYVPRPGGGYAYFQSGLDDAPRIVLDDGSGKTREIKRRVFGQMAFSRDGNFLAFASLGAVERKTSLADVYYYDIKDKRLYRVFDSGLERKSMHASDPDFSPADGGGRWMVMVRSVLNNDQLYVYDLLERRGYTITDAPAKTQFANPRFSPDGKKIVVSRKDATTGYRDIVVYSSVGDEIARVTDDKSIDMQPVFSNDGGQVYFTSSRTGIFNVFAYDLRTGAIRQATNALTGVFSPAPGAHGEVFVQAFSVENPYIQQFDPRHVNAKLWQGKGPVLLDAKPANAKAKRRGLRKKTAVLFEAPQTGRYAFDTGRVRLDAREVPDDLPLTGATIEEPDSKPIIPVQTEEDPVGIDSHHGKAGHRNSRDSAKAENVVREKKLHPSVYKDALARADHGVDLNAPLPAGAKKYTPLPHILRPTYLVPNVQMYDNAAIMSAQIGRFDPLYRHNWTGFVNYRTDAKYVGGGGTYVFSRYDPIFYVGGLRYAVDWGTVTTRAGTTHFFEDRWQTFVGMNYRWRIHGFNVGYFYEHREAFTPIAGLNLVNMQPYAGVKLQYELANFKKFPGSISQEDGPRIKLGFDVTNKVLLSDNVNEEEVATADARYYIEMPWSDHHVLALRVAGGWQWGDLQQFGTFRLGGPFGEGVGAAQYSNRVFPLRGLAGISYGGDRAFIFSAEYRLPLIENVNTGIGTWPIFLDKFYVAFFVDGGDIKFRTELQNLFTRMLVAPGAEFKGDFVLGYGLPITARLGYGVVLSNRDRLGNLQDAITRASLKYGSAYFQVGTSF